jgi:hypothetical protein
MALEGSVFDAEPKVELFTRFIGKRLQKEGLQRTVVADDGVRVGMTG